MQKHKKWLVITIWISAIAFIGAGMVNWGSYGFGLSHDKVARVGSIDIHMPEYQRVYSNIFQEYANIPQLKGILDESQAKQFGIPQIALQRLIQQTQLLNFAHDLGLLVSDEEVGKAIIDEKIYVDSQGNFSNEIYTKALQEQGLSKGEFEELIRKQLLIRKFFRVMNLDENTSVPLNAVTPLEVATLEFSNSIRDRLMLKVIPISQVHFEASESDIKAFWEQNASQWKTPMEFRIEYILSPYSSQNPSKEDLHKHYEDFKSDYLNERGELMSFEQSYDKLIKDVQRIEAESVSKREYRDLKNGVKKGSILSFKENEKVFIKQGTNFVIEDIKAAQIGQVLKPIATDDGYITLKVLDKKQSINQTYEQARADARMQYELKKRKENLDVLAKDSLANFHGKDVGFIAPQAAIEISTIFPELTQNQSMQLISKVYGSSDKEGYVSFDDKAVLYRVLEQKADFIKTNSQSAEAITFAKNAKSAAIFDMLADYLNKTYKTTLYIDVNK